MPTERLIEKAARACIVRKPAQDILPRLPRDNPLQVHARYVELQLHLVIREDFKPKYSDNEVGRPYDFFDLDDLLDAAQQGIVRRFWREAPALSVTAWIERTAQKFTVTPPTEAKKRRLDSGKPRLAAALLGLPFSSDTRKSLPFKALLRALQRAAPQTKPGRKESHLTIKDPTYRSLIDAYAGPDSPFAPQGTVNMDRIAEGNLLGVLGHWQISTREYDPRFLHTAFIEALGPAAAQTAFEVRAIMRNNGAEFIETVRRHVDRVISGGTVILHRVDELALQANLAI